MPRTKGARNKSSDGRKRGQGISKSAAKAEVAKTATRIDLSSRQLQLSGRSQTESAGSRQTGRKPGRPKKTDSVMATVNVKRTGRRPGRPRKSGQNIQEISIPAASQSQTQQTNNQSNGRSQEQSRVQDQIILTLYSAHGFNSFHVDTPFPNAKEHKLSFANPMERAQFLAELAKHMPVYVRPDAEEYTMLQNVQVISDETLGRSRLVA